MSFLLRLLVLVAPFAVLERFPRFQLRPAPLLRRWFASDVLYFGTSYAWNIGFAALYVAHASAWLEVELGLPRLSALELPMWVSVPLALLALDAGNYAAHYLLHRVGPLWEIHKVHHSSRTLDWLATFRSHLVEQGLRAVLGPLPAVLVGLPAPAVALAYASFAAHAIWNHSNLTLSFRFLEPIFITPRLHRLHHVPETTERNLGAVFSFWDRLRGTLVAGEVGPGTAFGVPEEVETYPQGWARQLVEPAARWLRASGSVAEPAA
jgi:lathosterol oxidase